MAAHPPAPAGPAQDMAGKVVLVSGATSGVGRVTAHVLARRGAEVGLIVRNPAKGAEVASEISAAGGRARVLLADLTLLADVRRVASEVLATYPRVHVLINNAGAMFSPRRTTPEGLERTWALNVLSPVLLARLLKSRLVESRPARVVNVDSVAHTWGHLQIHDLPRVHHYGMLRTYAQAKLALLMLSYELARRWEGQGVTVNALHPGFVRSGFGHNNSKFLSWGNRFAEIVGPSIPPEKGALTSIYAATSPELEGRSGLYLVREKPHASSKRSHDTVMAGRLWSIVSQQIGLPDAA